MSKTIERTTEGLRTMMLDELENYINGLNTTERMDTISKAATVICKTVVVDLEARKMLDKLKEKTDNPGSIDSLNINLPLGDKK